MRNIIRVGVGFAIILMLSWVVTLFVTYPWLFGLLLLIILSWLVGLLADTIFDS